MSAFDDIDIDIIQRRVESPTFVCAICDRLFEYRVFHLASEYRQGPTCPSCTRHWGHSNNTQRFHKSERIKVMRLSALVQALDWEVRNARYQG